MVTETILTKADIKPGSIESIIADLRNKKAKMEKYPGYWEDLPSQYVGAAIYAYIIDELGGLLIEEESEVSKQQAKKLFAAQNKAIPGEPGQGF